jgi:hypothetical protein
MRQPRGAPPPGSPLQFRQAAQLAQGCGHPGPVAQFFLYAQALLVELPGLAVVPLLLRQHPQLVEGLGHPGPVAQFPLMRRLSS